LTGSRQATPFRLDDLTQTAAMLQQVAAAGS
jgi:hypothetical protein